MTIYWVLSLHHKHLSNYFFTRKKTKERRNDLIDLMIDAMKDELNEDDRQEDDDQYDIDAKLSHR